MNKKARVMLAMLVTSVAVAGGIDNGSSPEVPPWAKFVTKPGKAWLTNGVCEHPHGGKPHLVASDWNGAWIRIERIPESPDDAPEFSVEVSPGIPDKEAWDNLTLVYVPGETSSDQDFPICASADSNNSAEAAAEMEKLEGWVESLTHKSADGTSTVPVRHKVDVYLWNQTVSDEGKTYGPLELVFFHEAGGSHNGIVH